MLYRQHQFTWYICTSLVALFCVSVHTQEFNGTYIQTLSAYAIASKSDILNSTCGTELQNFRDAINKRILWSLKILDSSGGFKSGFLYGNNYWLGSRSQCLDTMNINLPMTSGEILNNTQYRDPQQEIPPFEINYFVAYFRHNSSFQYRVHLYEEDVIMLGLCLPASCSTNDLSFILDRILHDRVLTNDLYFTNIYLIRVKDLKGDDNWLSGGTLLFICICLGFCFMTTIGTIYDIFIYQKYFKENEMNIIDDSIKGVSKEMETKLKSSHWKSVISKVLICFSAYTNTKKIFSTKLDVDAIAVIHGIKVLNTLIYFAYNKNFFLFTDNKVWMWRISENYGGYLFDPMIGAVTIDNFLFSSGCVLTYLYLKNKTNKILIKPIQYREKLTELFNYITRRFLRLTPTYMMVMGSLYLISNWFDKTSQIYMYERPHETCAKYWWRNLLYINNLFGREAICMNWSWYLAIDMQCYIIATMLLILSTMYFYAAVMILGALLLSSIIFTGYTSYVYAYVPAIHELYRFTNVLYFPTWMRINSYIIGIITGYILTKLNNNLFWKKKIIILCWCFFCFANVCNVFILFMIYNKRYVSVSIIAIYMALHKTLSGINIAWIVIACSTKHGGIVNKLLSFKGWIPFSRLTYCVYLLHPLIIRSISLYNETSIHFELLPTIVLAVGYIVISYFCAYALSLIVEMPCLLLMRMFIYRDTMPKKVL
ncbi:nose resistant to fluoxetine protein 6-like [Solenopsis invicta]|uniref:nose resistant to fluoxetine protein 6-like n=1 Tax=Solenopsis invicta TaxID=13686 RepID=UPI00193CDE3D|nr:nose resistant to fluoxetine protein 6-like [Solenopsis invicta]